MKVTARIYAEAMGDRWVAQFPTIDEDVCFPMGENGRRKALPNECFKALAASDMVQGVDWREDYLNQVVASWVRLINGWKEDNSIGEEAANYSRTMKRIGRRIDEARVTHVRAIWNQRADGISLSIRTDDHEVAEKRPWERIFAWKMAEAAVVVDEELADGGLLRIRMDECTKLLVAELKAWCAERDAERKLDELNRMRFVCGHHKCGYCAADAEGNPPDAECPCYSCGRCVEAKTIKAKDGKEVK